MAPVNKGDVVSLLPPHLCCNSTACFGEWEIRAILTINKTENLYMVVPTEGEQQAWRVVRLREINQVLRKLPGNSININCVSDY